MDKVDRVYRYLAATVTKGITFDNQNDGKLCAYADASYATHADCKSHSGVVIKLGKHAGPILVKSTKQKIITRSSTEAELVALACCLDEVRVIRKLLEELGLPQKPSVVYQDNTSSMMMTEKGDSTEKKAKHMRVRFAFIKEHIEKKDISLVYIPTGEMVADALTKPLCGKKFREFRSQLLNEHPTEW